MRSKTGQISIMVVCLIVGIMLSVQFRTTENYNNEITRESRYEDLTIKLNKVTEERDSLAREVVNLREKMSTNQDDDAARADIQEELRRANMVAGLLPVQGPGIIVTVDDSTRNVQPGENPNHLLVHDLDILQIVNEMRASGAEAISVNDERLTSMSEIRCAGTTILVNYNKVAPPFVIKAIGDPEMLASGLNIKGGYLESLKVVYGMEVQLQKSDKLELPAYKGPSRVKYSAPVEVKNPDKNKKEE